MGMIEPLPFLPKGSPARFSSKQWNRVIAALNALVNIEVRADTQLCQVIRAEDKFTILLPISEDALKKLEDLAGTDPNGTGNGALDSLAGYSPQEVQALKGIASGLAEAKKSNPDGVKNLMNQLGNPSSNLSKILDGTLTLDITGTATYGDCVMTITATGSLSS